MPGYDEVTNTVAYEQPHHFILEHYKTPRPASNVDQAFGYALNQWEKTVATSVRKLLKSTPTSSRTRFAPPGPA